MHRRRWSAVFALAGLVAAAGCWESDGHVLAPPTAELSPGSVPPGPLGDALPIDGSLAIARLSQPVDVVRDGYGMLHIYASTPEDAARVEGFTMARDRSAQLEFLRRASAGRLAEVFGAGDRDFLDQDIVMRTFGLVRLGEDKLASMEPQSPARRWVEAFADGVSQAFEQIRAGHLPAAGGLDGLEPRHFELVSPAEVLAIDRFYVLAASMALQQELAFEELLQRFGSAFPSSSDDPAIVARSRALPDLFRFAPPVEAYSADGLGHRAPPGVSHASTLAGGGSGLLERDGSFERALERLRGVTGVTGAGSNAWAVAPVRTKNGATLFASDPHMRLSSPAQLWLVHLEVQASSPDSGLSAAGAARVGVPWIDFGFNDLTAWGTTGAHHDVADLYAEQITGGGSAVRFRGGNVQLEVREERILDAAGKPLSVRVRTVPHHGVLIPEIRGHKPVEPEEGAFALSVRWAGAEAFWSPERALALMRAGSVDEALTAVRDAPSCSQSFVLADAAGAIAFADAAAIPLRDPRAMAWDAVRYTGQLPCRVLPGDGSAEWVGWLAPSLAPGMRDPLTGTVAAANSDPTGGTFDNHPGNEVLLDGTPAYLGCTFDAGFRLARIQHRLQEPGRHWSAEQMADMQADVRSALGARLTAHLVAAMQRALSERASPGTFPTLTDVALSSRFAAADIPSWVELLVAWESETDFRASAGVKFADMLPTADPYDAMASRATLAFNAWLPRVLQLLFDDELARLGGRALADQVLVRSLLHLLETNQANLASYLASAKDSVLWDDLDTPAIESRDERIVVAFLDALDWIAERFGDHRDDWRWGRVHTVTLQPLGGVLGMFPVPESSDPTFPSGFPRAGDLFVVDVAAYDATPSSFADLSFSYEEGPGLRLVVELAPGGPFAWGALAGGQDAAVGSGHFRDELEYWRHNQNHPWAVRRVDVVATAERREVAWNPIAETTATGD